MDASVLSAIVGKCRLLAELGAGGMARVYLAVMRGSRGMRKLVVLKIPRDEVAGDAQLSGMFVDEARLAMRLNHRNIVQTYEVIEEDGRDILCMEYLDGQTLSSILSRCRRKAAAFPLEMHIRVLVEALNGLHYAHELRDFDGHALNIVHRDTSPQNIFVTFDGEVKLLDFGVAKAAISSTVTRAGTIKGKVRYMPPEQLVPTSSEPIDRRADIYAMGVMLWEAATGRPLWDKVSDLDLMANVMTENVPSPRDVVPNVDPRLDAIVRKALAFKRDDRYATCHELQTELEEFATTLPRCTVAEVAQFTAELFDDARQKRKAVIEEQLARSLSDDQQRVLPYGALDVVDSARLVPITGMQSVPRYDVSAPGNSAPPTMSSRSLVEGARSRRPRTVVIASAAVFVAVVALFLVVRGWGTSEVVREPVAHGGGSATANGAQAPPPTTDPLPKESRPLTLSLQARPTNATFSLDGNRLGGNPAILRVPPDEVVHTLRIEAGGYVTKTVELRFNADKDMTFVLDREPSPPSAVNAPSRGRTPSQATAPKTSEPPPSSAPLPPTSPPDPSNLPRPKRTPRSIDDKL